MCKYYTAFLHSSHCEHTLRRGSQQLLSCVYSLTLAYQGELHCSGMGSQECWLNMEEEKGGNKVGCSSRGTDVRLVNGDASVSVCVLGGALG